MQSSVYRKRKKKDVPMLCITKITLQDKAYSYQYSNVDQ